MSAIVITVVNQKGGSGKTSTTMQLAGGLAKRGYKCMVVDADPQNTAVTWAAAAPDDKPFPASVINLSEAQEKVPQLIRPYIGDYDVIIVDCPPSLESKVPLSVLLVSDIALVPVLPSPPDMWASIGITEIIDHAISAINEDLKVKIILNQVVAKRTLSGDALEVLKEFPYPLAKTKLHQREAYRQCAAIGGTVHDLGNRAKAAIMEIESLVDEVVELFNN